MKLSFALLGLAAADVCEDCNRNNENFETIFENENIIRLTKTFMEGTPTMKYQFNCFL